MRRLRNYVNENQKLPLFGVGPFLVLGMTLLTVTGIALSYTLLKTGNLDGIWVWIFRNVGAVLIIGGLTLWLTGAFATGVFRDIANNNLKTDGLYAWVRNPMYAGCWIFLAGVILLWRNYFILPVIFLNWLLLTLVLKNIEEKWLLKLYGQKYASYKKSVNRCIPWFPKKQK